MYRPSGKKQFRRTAPKSIKPTTDRIGQLKYRVGRNGIELNILEWLRSRKDYKITKFPTEFRDCLRSGIRKKYNMDEKIEDYAYEPEKPIGKDYWVPKREEFNRLGQLRGRKLEYEEKIIYNQWVKARQEENVMTKTRNDTVKKARDEIIARGGSARQDMISTLMGAILEDMSLDSQQRVKTWIRRDFTTPGYNRALMATNLEQAYKIQDWMFIDTFAGYRRH
jgi:hypothetical protein